MCVWAQSFLTLASPWAIVLQVPLFMEFLEWLPFPTLWDLPDPGIELTSLASSAPTGGFFTTEPPESEVKVKSLSHV